MSLGRLCVKTRSRQQRRRLAVWLGTLSFVVCVVYYNNVLWNQEPTHLQIASAEAGRKPMAARPEARAAPKVTAGNEDLDLMPDLAPAVLHYIWCGRRTFEFKHYLSLKSACRAVKPDKVFFHYEHLPTVDEEGYYSWFNETLSDVDHFLPRTLNSSSCPESGKPERYILVLTLLEKFGGIYVPDDSLWVDFPVYLRTESLVSGVTPRNPLDYEDGIIVGKKGSFKIPSDPDELLITLSLGRQDPNNLRSCASISTYDSDVEGHIICVKIKDQLYPKDIWSLDSRFGMLARVVSYGSTDVQPFFDQKIRTPNIGHYVCVDCYIKFATYLSMLSAIFVAGLSKVYVHGVQKPAGPWWERLKQDPRYIFVYREYPESEFDKAIMSPQLALGIMRLDILLKYGGVYQDNNVMWTRKIPEEYFGYECVASPDWHLHGHWPDSVNHGAIMATRNARYLLKLRTIYHKMKHQQFWYNDHYMAYKIVERYPNLIFLDRHFQVKCLNHNCHPTWQPNYKSGLMQNRPGGKFNWENETMSIHWTDTFPEMDVDMVKYTSGLVIDVGRNILQRADISLNNLK